MESKFDIRHNKLLLHTALGQGEPILCPNSCPFAYGCGLHVSNPITQTASRSVQPFLHTWPQCLYTLYNGTPLSPS